VKQHGEPRCALDQGADRRALQPDDQITFRVAGNGAIFSLRRPVGDRDVSGDEAVPRLPRPHPRHPQRPPGPQARGQLTLQAATRLHVKGLVDRLVRDPHRLIVGEVDRQPVRDLLRTPRRRPPAILPPPDVSPDPGARLRPSHLDAVLIANLARQPLLDVLARAVIDG
jgi:hypothetical protein